MRVVDHPQFDAQVPAAHPRREEERRQLHTQPGGRGVPNVRLSGDCLHRCDGVPEPAGECRAGSEQQRQITNTGDGARVYQRGVRVGFPRADVERN